MHTPHYKGACSGTTKGLYWHYKALVAALQHACSPLQGTVYRQVAYNLLANKHLITISFKMK